MMEPQEVFYPVTPAWSGTPAWLVYFGFKHMILALSSWPSVGLTFMAPLLPRRGLAQDRGQQGAVLLPCRSFWLEAPGSQRKHGVQVNKWPFVRKVN